MTTASNSRVLRIIHLLLIIAFFCTSVFGKVISIDDDGQADFDNIQAGINAAVDGDTILVAPGTYTGFGNHDINFQGKAITVRSTDPNDPAIIASTIIDCQEQGCGFTFESGEQADSIVEGITVTNGKRGGIHISNSSPTITKCTISNNLGGGIYCDRGSPMIVDSIIENNTTFGFTEIHGGGISFYGSDNPSIINCTIRGNSTNKRGDGGGIYIHGYGYECQPVISHCSIIGNTSCLGGGLYIYYSSPVISHCTIANNHADSNGGLYLEGMGRSDRYIIRVEHCRISGNSANTTGGLSARLCTLHMYNCVVSGNSCGFSGGGLSLNTWTVAEIDQCTIVGNNVVEDPPGKNHRGGGLYLQMCDVKITNSIIRQNRATKGAQLAINAWDGVQSPNMSPIEDPTLVTLLYNDFNSEQDQELYIYGEPNRLTLEMHGNLDVDPCFADPGFWDPNGTPDDPNDDFWVDGDYHLKSPAGRWDQNSLTWVADDVTSPCIDAGDPNSPIGHEPFPNGGIINMGAYGGTAEASKSLNETSIYIFWPEQSMLIQTGGIASVNWTYTLAGQFQLTVDYGTGKAWLSDVDATATDYSEPVRKLDPNDVFNLTGLTGTISRNGSIEFTGQTADESKVLLYLTLSDEWISLKGQTTPPPNSADFFIFELDAVAKRKYGGGIGERNNPFLIYTAEDLNAISTEPNDWDKHFNLMADIDLSGYSYDKAVIAPDLDTDEYYFQGIPFGGVFDGNGHTISHLTIMGDSYLGLFGQLDLVAKIKDLGVVDIDIMPDVNISNSEFSDIGGLVGYNRGSIIRCYSSGIISNVNRIGGLVGENTGNVNNCSSTCSVTGIYMVGGLIGDSWDGNITDCYSNSVVTCSYYAGGLVGSHTSNITNCYSTGEVIGREAVGGLIGQNGVQGVVPYPGYIDKSYSLSNVRGEIYVGGLVGDNRVGSVMQSYSTGGVTGNEYVGGLVGQSYFGSIAYSYSTGEVSDGDSYVGGLVGGGWLLDTTASFWDIQTSGQTSSYTGTDKTTSEMQTASTFLEAGWDFVDEITNGTEDIWWILEGKDYPRLLWQTDN